MSKFQGTMFQIPIFLEEWNFEQLPMENVPWLATTSESGFWMQVTRSTQFLFQFNYLITLIVLIALSQVLVLTWTYDQ